MHFKREDIDGLDRIKRLNIINGVTGIKPANLIGTKSAEGYTNLAIFSSLIHLGSNPALLGFITRPSGEVERHTLSNIIDTGFYTINQVHQNDIEKAHYTSAKFEKGQSEFEYCQFQEEYLSGFVAPFVKESKLKIGMKFLERMPIKLNGTQLIIGEIQHLIIPDESINEAGHIDLENIGATGLSGLNNYYAVEKIGSFPYARVKEMPDFSS